jgi:N-acetylglucosaminyl-diphospho-decaprenol L-rhamnosyltransferase
VDVSGIAHSNQDDSSLSPTSSSSQAPAPNIDVVIVNWNSRDYLGRCLSVLPTVQAQSGVGFHIVVIDNASSDGSADSLETGDVCAEVVRNAQNRGFGAASNQGARMGSAPYILFLNPDVVLYPESVRIPLDFLEAAGNERVGICGVQLINEHGGLSRSCSRFPTLRHFLAHIFGLHRLFPDHFRGLMMTEWDHGSTQPVDQVMGAFFLLRREVFESLDGFDERFFVYFEDLDFALRARKMGWESYYLANARAEHAGGGCTRNAAMERLFYALRSRMLYGYKHFGWQKATTLLICTMFFEPFSRLALAAGRGSFAEAKTVIQGYYELWTLAPSLFVQAREAAMEMSAAEVPK